MAVAKITNEVKLAIERKTAKTLPDQPTARGYTAQTIRNTLYKWLSDSTNSLFAELDRIIDEINAQVDNVTDGTTDITYDNASSDLTAATIQAAIDELDSIIDNILSGVTNITYNNSISGLIATTLKAAIDELDSEIDKIKSGATVVAEATKATNDSDDNAIKTTYEKLANKRTSWNSTPSNTFYPSEKLAKDSLDLKVNKAQSIIGINLQDDITLSEFKTALGNATQSVAGLLSAEDKTHLDGLVALLASSDGNTVVDTIGEILAIFQNYPEGADLVTVLNGKVDKEAGKGLSQNDFTDIDKNKVNLSYTHSEIVDGSNPHNTKFVNIADKPTTRDGYGITDVYTKPETYTRLEINNLLDNLSAVKGLKSTLLTPTELSNGDTISTNLLTNNGAFVVFTATNTSIEEVDSDVVPVSTIKNGKKFVFFDNQEIVFTIGETNSTFETSENVTLKINLLYLDSENVQAVGVEFDGSLTNYLLNQENVQSAISELDEELKTTNDNLSNKVDKNNAIVAGTKTKITYDSKGLVTGGDDLAESDIPTLPTSKITQTSTSRFVSDTEKSTWNSKQPALGFTPENQANKKTTLTDNDVDFPTTKAVKTAIDTAISQTLKPMGNWNASTNTPTLTNSDISKANQVYYVNVAGTQFGITFGVGDELVYNTNGVIFKRDNVDSVISVNGKEGVVALTQDDIADGSTYKRVTNTEKSTWNGKQNALTPGDGISISGDVISATNEGYPPDEETITLNGNDELEATNVAIWRYA